jgi:cobalt/nickel transport system permease protein
MSTLTNHVPDPRLITAYAEQWNGPLHDINPWTKVFVLPIVVLAITIIDNLVVITGIYAAMLGLYALSGLPVRRLLYWYTLPVMFVVTIIGPLAFGEPGVPIGGVAIETPLGGLSLTWAGLTLFLTMAFRSLAVVTYSLTIAMTTKYNDVAYVLGRTLPRPVDQIALLTYRFTFVMIETLENLVNATQSRGGSLLRDFWGNRRQYGRVFGMTFLTAVERSERMTKAMESRGYDGDLTLYSRVKRPPVRDLVVVAALLGMVIAYEILIQWQVIA